MVDAALWEAILWASTDKEGEPLDHMHDMSAAWREDMETLSREFYAWRNSADDVLIACGFGEQCLEDLLGDDRCEHVYVLVRDGHGVGMADNWQADSPEAMCCEQLEALARAQGPIGATVGDDDRIYLSWCD